jgi:tRNA threonylcarbamoyl adenosine modification protein YeaZ
MYLLSLETTSPVTSIALLEDDTVLRELLWRSRDAGREIIAAVDTALAPTGLAVDDIARLVVSTGPGSWTGIRLGFGLALGLAKGDSRKLYGVSSLEGIAFQLGETRDTGVVIPSVATKFHCARYADREALVAAPEPFLSGDIAAVREHLKRCGLVAVPEQPDAAVRFAAPRAREIPLSPRASASGRLALARILRGITPKNTPGYEK